MKCRTWGTPFSSRTNVDECSCTALNVGEVQPRGDDEQPTLVAPMLVRDDVVRVVATGPEELVGTEQGLPRRIAEAYEGRDGSISSAARRPGRPSVGGTLSMSTSVDEGA